MIINSYLFYWLYINSLSEYSRQQDCHPTQDRCHPNKKGGPLQSWYKALVKFGHDPLIAIWAVSTISSVCAIAFQFQEEQTTHNHCHVVNCYCDRTSYSCTCKKKKKVE